MLFSIFQERAYAVNLFIGVIVRNLANGYLLVNLFLKDWGDVCLVCIALATL
jgi:hypothetical protein